MPDKYYIPRLLDALRGTSFFRLHRMAVERFGQKSADHSICFAVETLCTWSQKPAVLDFDKTLLDALWSSTASDRIPCGVLKHLPFNPFIWQLEDRLLLTSFGLGGEDASGRLSFWAVWMDKDPMRWSLGVVPIEDSSIQETFGSDQAKAIFRDNTRFIFRRTLPVLLYLASKEPDIERCTGPSTGHASPRRRARRRGRRLDVEEHHVGFRVGATLRGGGHPHQPTPRREAGAGGAATGRRPRSHLRRAHWHLYWTGKGRQEPSLRWIAPTLVGATGTHDLVEMRRVEGRP